MGRLYLFDLISFNKNDIREQTSPGGEQEIRVCKLPFFISINTYLLLKGFLLFYVLSKNEWHPSVTIQYRLYDFKNASRARPKQVSRAVSELGSCSW